LRIRNGIGILKEKYMHKRYIAERIAWNFLGKPYIWGGDDPMKGFDCSGFVIEILKSIGILPMNGDWTAQGLRKMFLEQTTPVPKLGRLVFWHGRIETTKAVHVEFCLNEELSIGASGGNSEVKTEKDAILRNAFIKIRPIRTRPYLLGFVDPFIRL
jgi:hypothetical protein